MSTWSGRVWGLVGALVVLTVMLGACATGDVSVSDGERYSTPESSDAERIQEAMEALAESCMRDVSGGRAHADQWGEAIHGRHVSVRYEKPRELEVSGVPLKVTQIVVPLPENDLPERIWVRADGQIRALSRYSIDRLSELVCDDVLAVTSDEPYRRLCERTEGGS